ncbi:MAG: D-glycero-beta-D-manno-heptose-7-phosphate kinase [bacterium]|nr:MAG: D-glycero-beta-D-manno-heptose-7-phosphate kinase [bacterium]
MRRRRVRRICEAMKGSTVAVIGDLMLDRYIWGQVERISPEAPVPVVSVESTNVRMGGAANVAWNLVSLGITVPLVAVVGTDPSARQIRTIIAESGIETGLLVKDRNRVTTEKIRIIAHNQQVVRADFEATVEVVGKSLGRLLDAIERAVRRADLVVVSDYGKGVVCAPVMDKVRSLAAERGIPVLVDPKEGHFALYRGCFAITPNTKEAGGFYNTKIKSDEELEKVGRSLLHDLEATAVLITRGEGGMTLFGEGQATRHFSTMASDVYDVTGAGDTVIGILGAALVAGAAIGEAIELANAAAGIVVREVGTAAVGADELISAFRA